MRIRPRLKVRSIAGDNVVIVNGAGQSDMTKVITLNETSLYLWNSLKDKEFEIEDVVAALMERYDVEQQKASEDSKAWVGKLQSLGVII